MTLFTYSETKNNTQFNSMNIFKHIAQAACTTLLVLAGLSTHAQDKNVSDSKTLPSDKAVITGKLDNGFSYYIRKNEMPTQRAVLYLVTKAGSILETENQLGLAHFAEHMAFKGTKNFPKNELINYLQKAGVRFGADLNAYTSFDETVYQLPIPSDDSLLLVNGFQILRDWAQDVLMESSEIDSERGVIFEEKRQRKGVQQRIQEKTLPILLNGSRYIERLPIGEEKVFMNFDHSEIRQFYKDWYRPDLQAIVAVGDFDEAYVEDLIRKLFADLKTPENAPERTEYKIELTGKNNYLPILDDEITTTNVQIFHKYKTNPTRTEQDLLNALSTGVFNSLLNTRINDLRKQKNPPFVSAAAQISSVFSGVGSATIMVTLKPEEYKQGMQAVFTELKRARDFGFTEGELDRAKHSFLEDQAYQYRERNKTTSQAYADTYLNVFLKDSPYPDAEFYYEFYKNNIDKITLETVYKSIEKFYSDIDRDVFVLAPTKEETNIPSLADILAWKEEVESIEIQAYEDADLSGDLVSTTSEPGVVVSKTEDTKLGTTTLTFSNGLKAVLKPTDFRNDQILISAFSPGGTALYGQEDYQSAVNAASIIGQSGLGNFDSKTLPKKLTGKIASVSPYISEYFEGFSAQTSVRDFETGLQLINLYYTAPRAEQDLIEGVLKNARESVKNRYQSPINVFSDTINNIMSNYHWRRMPITLDEIDNIRTDRALDIYKERFANAGDFTFVFTGSFNVDSIQPLLAQYLGNLPANKQREKVKDVGVKTLQKAIHKVVYKGTEERATVQLVLPGSYKNNKESALYFTALQEILDYRLMDRLRSKEGAVYTPSVHISKSVLPTPRYTVQVGFTCDPARVDELINDVKEEMDKLVKEGVTDEEIQKVIAESTRSYEVNLKQNNFWHSSIAAYLQVGQDPADILNVESRIKNIDKKKVEKLAKKTLDAKKLSSFVLLPESAAK